ncbi:hypothetical protein ADICYQ_1955 [Cyclobacterium qasimii M12-11B]|uniref:Uncharacterized protein n=1 Tax=Cyclobacterium qasimii M12-11B TaxID=641524 RepID=S7VFK4_9BACT|nr:hypothetical protein ADICYQ_1955 [Cyclobacterium qasimii M12-11B]
MVGDKGKFGKIYLGFNKIIVLFVVALKCKNYITLSFV